MKALALGLLLVSIEAAAAGCYESSILKPTPFLGNDGEIVKLADGSLWEVKYEYNYMYSYYPQVTICPDSGRLIVDGKSINVQALR